MWIRASISVSLLAGTLLGFAGGALAQDWRTATTARQRHGEETFEAEIEYAVGRFELIPGSGTLLYRIESRYDARYFELKTTYGRKDDAGVLEVDFEGERGFQLDHIRDDFDAGSLKFAVTDAVPVSLDIELGAAEAQLEFGGLKLRRINLETGASDTRVQFSQPNTEVAERCEFEAGAASFRLEGLGNSGCRELSVDGGVGTLNLDFSGAWGYDASGEITVGLGTVEIRVPRSLGVRVERETFLMSFDAPGFTKRGDAWLSENWEEAEHKLTLKVSGALGSVELARR